MTVSNVVNGRTKEMREETRLRVEKSMRELNYVPNSQARGLRIQKTNTLAFLLLDSDPKYLADPMTDLVISGVGAVAREHGYMVLVHAAQPDRLDPGLLMPLRQNRADGALLLLSGEIEMRRKYIEEAKRLTANFVVFEDSADEEVSTVTADNRSGAYGLTRHLLQRGHRRIAFIASGTSWPMIEQRFAGYREALTEAGIEPSPRLTRFDGGWSAANGGHLATQLCDLAEPPTAILAGNDLMAIGAIKALRTRGLRVPQDISVAGFDDFAFSEHVDPPLTTVHVPGFELGHRAATRLLEQIENPDGTTTADRLPVDIVIRGSA